MKKYTAKSDHPDSSALNHECYQRGCELFLARRYNKAKLEFKEALAYWPQDPQAWMALGNCDDALNHPKAAERSFRRALQYCQDADRHGILFNLANSLLDQALYDAAIELYEQIPAESDVYAKAQRNLGIARKGPQ